MKHLILIILIALNFNAFAQDDKTVTLVVSGSGKTKDEAKQNALRSAIEQAFGTFISSKTEILNDNLVKDEIVSVSNGNIQKFDIISEVQIPDGGFATTLNATVSVTKLTSFVESKGVEVEFKGGLFAMNIKLQKLNEVAEYKAVLNLCEVSREILSKSIDYSLDVSEPVAYNGSSDLFLVNFNVTCSPNKNAKIFEDYFWETISKISMPNEEIENYKKVQKQIYLVARSKRFFNDYGGGCNDCFDPIFSNRERYNIDTIVTKYYLRNKTSQVAIKELMIETNKYLYDFRILSEVDTILIKRNNIEVENPSFGILKQPENNEMWSVYSNYHYGFPECLLFSGDQFGFRTNGEYFLRINKYIRAGMYYDMDFGKIDRRQLSNGLDIYIRNIQDKNSVNFVYAHVLPLSQLEKISKYKIELFRHLQADLNVVNKEKDLGLIPSLKFNSKGYVKENNMYDMASHVDDFLKLNNIAADSLPSGLIIHVNKKGNGIKPKNGQKVSIQYNAYLINGHKYESSFDFGKPFNFIVGYDEIITGLTEGVKFMEFDSKATIIIPSKLAYGGNGTKDVPPYSVLIFEVELLPTE